MTTRTASRQLPHVGMSVLVGPVELVEDPVAVLEVEVDAFGFDVEASLPTVTALPDEPMFQDDGGEVVLAGDRVFQGRAPCLADTGNPEPAVDAVIVDLDIGADDPGHLEGRAEDR